MSYLPPSQSSEVYSLLQVITDPKKTKERLDQLVKASEEFAQHAEASRLASSELEKDKLAVANLAVDKDIHENNKTKFETWKREEEKRLQQFDTEVTQRDNSTKAAEAKLKSDQEAFQRHVETISTQLLQRESSITAKENTAKRLQEDALRLQSTLQDKHDKLKLFFN